VPLFSSQQNESFEPVVVFGLNEIIEMKARLFCTTGLFSGSNFEFDQEATIGKHKNNSIVLSPPIVSNRHARIYFDEKSQCYILEDLGSRNGTHVDGVRVKKKEKLDSLNIITFAQKFDFIFQATDNYEREPVEKKPARKETASAARAKTRLKKTAMAALRAQDETAEAPPVNGKTNGKTMLEAVRLVPVGKMAPTRNGKTLIESMAMGKKMPAAQPVFFLEVNSNERGIKSFRLKNGENFLGRSPQCEIAIDDLSISRRHAVLTLNNDKVFVKDLGSRNHTFIGRQTLIAETEIQLETTMRFGHVEAQLIRRAGNEKSKASSIAHLV
jgi:pSer/pThr/pTyr-binding forkhead associated (FHA) protein